jgi:hypothetical protein
MAIEKYVYTADDLSQFYVYLESANVRPNSGLDLADGTETGVSAGRPIKFKLRGIHWQANTGGARKFLVAGTNDSELYVTAGSTAITVDGVAGTTTGRRGEKSSF